MVGCYAYAHEQEYFILPFVFFQNSFETLRLVDNMQYKTMTKPKVFISIENGLDSKNKTQRTHSSFQYHKKTFLLMALMLV